MQFYEFEAQARAGKGRLVGPKEVDVTLAVLEKTVPPATDVVSPEGGGTSGRPGGDPRARPGGGAACGR